MPKITIPANGWKPRKHQMSLWGYLEHGGKRAVEIAHRRWGKDDVALHWAAVAAMTRVGGMFHMLPEYAQARKAIWTAVNPHTGKRRIDEAFPHLIRENTNEQEMFIRFKNGSTWQVVGSDNFDRLVGVSVAGMTFSEWATANPAAWAYLAPVVAENNGWALFITTPRGRNHAYNTLKLAQANRDWFAEVSPVSATNAISQKIVEEQRVEYRSLFGLDAGDALIDQEFNCSFEAAILGSYYGKEMSAAEVEGRIAAVPIWPEVPVHTAWDLGVSRGSDTMVAWFFQIVPSAGGRAAVRIVDYYSASGMAIKHYADLIQQRAHERGYLTGTDFVPHDARVPEMTSSGRDGRAKQRIEVMIECGMKPKIVQDHKVADGISAVRQIIGRCHWDAERCKDGIEALRQYQHEWDPEARIFKDTPKKDWSTHPADAFRYLAMAYRELRAQPQPEPGRMFTMDPDTLPAGVKGVKFDQLWKTAPRASRRI